MIKVVIIDDQVILRESLKLIVEQDEEIKVVGLGEDGREALKICDEKHPDIVLMDIMMPRCNGIEGTKLIKTKYSSIKIIVLTTFNDDENIQKALENGADGYVLKDIKPAELIHAIKTVKIGLNIMHKNIYDVVLKKFEKKDRKTKVPEISISLTDRELNIVNLIVDGNNNKEIAEKLFLSEGTVKNIISTILTKLKLKDRTQLAVFAIKNNLV